MHGTHQVNLLKVEFIKKHLHFLELCAEDKFDVIIQVAELLEENMGYSSDQHKRKVWEGLKIEHILKSCQKCKANIKNNWLDY